jgi:hypothetical protein
VIAADNLFDLPGRAATTVDQNDLTLFKAPIWGSVLTVLAAKAQLVMIRTASAVTPSVILKVSAHFFTLCRSTHTSRQMAVGFVPRNLPRPAKSTCDCYAILGSRQVERGFFEGGYNAIGFCFMFIACCVLSARGCCRCGSK